MLNGLVGWFFLYELQIVSQSAIRIENIIWFRTITTIRILVNRIIVRRFPGTLWTFHRIQNFLLLTILTKIFYLYRKSISIL